VLYVALAEAAVLAVVVIAFAGLLRSKERSCARREDAMLNKLLHAVGTPWEPSPVSREWDRAHAALEQSQRDAADEWTVNPELEV
jgi:hypothetical protein